MENSNNWCCLKGWYWDQCCLMPLSLAWTVGFSICLMEVLSLVLQHKSICDFRVKIKIYLWNIIIKDNRVSFTWQRIYFAKQKIWSCTIRCKLIVTEYILLINPYAKSLKQCPKCFSAVKRFRNSILLSLWFCILGAFFPPYEKFSD